MKDAVLSAPSRVLKGATTGRSDMIHVVGNDVRRFLAGVTVTGDLLPAPYQHIQGVTNKQVSTESLHVLRA